MWEAGLEPANFLFSFFRPFLHLAKLPEKFFEKNFKNLISFDNLRVFSLV